MSDAHLPRLVVFTGSPRTPSRSKALGMLIAEAVAARLPVRIEAHDVVEAGRGLGSAYSREELPQSALQIVEAIEEADGLILITPVQKGSFTGLFKHLIDFVDVEALIDVPAVIGATGGGYRHALVVEHQLRPLLGFFSAATVPTSVYASDKDFDGPVIADQGVAQRVELAAAQMASMLESRFRTAQAKALNHHNSVAGIAASKLA